MHPRAVFKFVVENDSDLDEVDGVVARFGLDRVWVMPQAQDRETLYRRLGAITPAAIRRGYRVSTRQQIEIWGGERGR